MCSHLTPQLRTIIMCSEHMPIRGKSPSVPPSAVARWSVPAISQGMVRDLACCFRSGAEPTVRESSVSTGPVRHIAEPRRRPGGVFNQRKSGVPRPWRRTSDFAKRTSWTGPEDAESKVTVRGVRSGRVTNGALVGVNVLASAALHSGRPGFLGRAGRPVLKRNEHPLERTRGQCRGPLVTQCTETRLGHSVWRASP